MKFLSILIMFFAPIAIALGNERTFPDYVQLFSDGKAISPPMNVTPEIEAIFENLKKTAHKIKYPPGARVKLNIEYLSRPRMVYFSIKRNERVNFYNNLALICIGELTENFPVRRLVDEKLSQELYDAVKNLFEREFKNSKGYSDYVQLFSDEKAISPPMNVTPEIEAIFENLKKTFSERKTSNFLLPSNFRLRYFSIKRDGRFNFYDDPTLVFAGTINDRYSCGKSVDGKLSQELYDSVKKLFSEKFPPRERENP